MKKVLKIVLIFVLVLVVASGAFVIWQWNNVKALFIALNSPSEKITTLIEENNAKTNEILNKLTDTQMRALSDDERKQLEEGKLSEEEAIKLINGKTESTYDNKKGKSEEIDKIISRIYLLRAEYLNALDNLVAEAKTAVSSVSPKELTISKKLELAEIFTGKGVALESQCDAKMESLISQLKSELEKINGDMNVISDIRAVYESEKKLKKSELFNKYNPYK